MDFTQIDQAINNFLPNLEAYQVNYIKTNQAYFDAPFSNAQVPTGSATADNVSIAPQGKNTTWTDTGLINSKVPFTVQCLEYLTPDGNRGWQANFKVKDGITDTIYIKSFGYGKNATALTLAWSSTLRTEQISS